MSNYRYEFDARMSVLIRTSRDASPMILRKTDPVWRLFGPLDDAYRRAIYLGQGCWERLDTITEEHARMILRGWGVVLDTESTNEKDDLQGEMKMKTLVAFFSAEGNTAKCAKALAETYHFDLFEIIPQNPYSTADLNWKNPLARCNREKFGKKDVPVQGKVENWEEYDTVFLGFPIGYYGAPNVINTFCRSYDWSGKRVILFATSGGSDIGKTAKKLEPCLSGDPKILGAAVYRSTAELLADAEKLL